MHQITAVTEHAIGKGILFSNSGCKKPRHPVSSAIPTKGSITRNPSGIIYHADPFGVPQHSANISAAVQNKPTTRVAVNGLGV